MSAHGQIPTNVFTRVLLIEAGDATGSAFTIDVDGRQYFITAKHVVSKVSDNDSIKLRRLDGWTSAHVKVLRCDDPVDIAVLIPDKQVTLNFPLEPSMLASQLGQDMYFLGFPYGQEFSDVKMEKVSGRISIPFIKKAIWSASSPAGDDGSVLFLDGHNNPGFSGGPIVFRAFDQPGYVMRVAGVISGYTPDLQFVLEPKK
jgi:S1-C subfamily serine protease